MLALNDTRWLTLKGGYRLPYDASEPLRRLESGENVWDELWDNLHHQGDVDEASYAAVPQLVRIAAEAPSRNWNVYALVALIEIERHRVSNPQVPPWLVSDYELAWRGIADLALHDLAAASDPFTVHSALSIVALARGERKLGALLSHFDSSEVDELAEDKLAWSKLYG
jgi:hypothetical protein